MLSMFAPVLLAFLRPDIPGWGRGPFPLSGLHKLPSPPAPPRPSLLSGKQFS